MPAEDLHADVSLRERPAFLESFAPAEQAKAPRNSVRRAIMEKQQRK